MQYPSSLPSKVLALLGTLTILGFSNIPSADAKNDLLQPAPKQDATLAIPTVPFAIAESSTQLTDAVSPVYWQNRLTFSERNTISSPLLKPPIKIARDDTYWGPQRDFEIQMPGEVVVNTKNTLTTTNATTGTLYIIVHLDLPVDGDLLSSKGIRQILQAAFRQNLEGKVIKTANIEIQGYPGIEFLVEHSNGTRGQYYGYVVKERVYMLGAISFGELTTEATNFFDSFKIYPSRIIEKDRKPNINLDTVVGEYKVVLEPKVLADAEKEGVKSVSGKWVINAEGKFEATLKAVSVRDEIQEIKTTGKILLEYGKVVSQVETVNGEPPETIPPKQTYTLSTDGNELQADGQPIKLVRQRSVW